MPDVRMPDGNVVTLSDDPNEARKQFAELQLLVSPSRNQHQTSSSAIGEFGKGAARGFVGMTRAIGEGLQPPADTVPEQYRIPHNEALVDLNKKIDSMVAADPQAEKGWGTAGEVVGGMFAPGAGMIGGIGKGSAMLPPFANQYAPHAMQEYVSHVANTPMFSNMQRRLGRWGTDVVGRFMGVPWLGRRMTEEALDAFMRTARKAGYDPAAPLPIHTPVQMAPTAARVGKGLFAPYIVDSGLEEEQPSRESSGKIK